MIFYFCHFLSTKVSIVKKQNLLMKLNYKKFGKGKPVFILHGLFGMLDNWQVFAKKLAEKYEVITVDLRNHGKSPHSPDFDYSYMADDILELMQDIGCNKCSFIGHSMGGKLAMTIALDNPLVVDKLIILDIGTKKYPKNHIFLLDILCNINIDRYTDRLELEHELRSVIEDSRLRQFIMKNIKRDAEGGFSWKMNLEVIKDNYDTIIEEISSESIYQSDVLFVRGGQSNYILNNDFEKIKELFPKAKLATIENAGHWIHADESKKLFDIITDYLDNSNFS